MLHSALHVYYEEHGFSTCFGKNVNMIYCKNGETAPERWPSWITRHRPQQRQFKANPIILSLAWSRFRLSIERKKRFEILQHAKIKRRPPTPTPCTTPVVYNFACKSNAYARQFMAFFHVHFQMGTGSSLGKIDKDNRQQSVVD